MKKLYRSQTDRKIAGIFGGLGDYFNIDSNVLRLLAVLVFLVSGFFPVLITYVIAWLILPDEGAEVTSSRSEVSSQKPSEPKQKPAAKKRTTSGKSSTRKTSK
jgi:phage shock protein C